jgi:RimJ/RimL family protein N-acetyltransferase
MDALDYAFTRIGLHKLNAEVLIDNPRSLYLHKKVGFIEEGQFRGQRLVGDDHIDIIRLGLLVNEWQNRREKLEKGFANH